MWKGKANEYFSNNRIMLLVIILFPTIKIRKNMLEIPKVKLFLGFHLVTNNPTRGCCSSTTDKGECVLI